MFEKVMKSANMISRIIILMFLIVPSSLFALYEASTVDVWWWVLHWFARWNLVEIGINQTGWFGWNLSFQPAWYHATSSRAPGNKIGFISNPQDNDWVTYDGDFFTPWTPLEWFGMKIWTTNYTNDTAGLQWIPGAIRSAWTLVRWWMNVAQLTWTWSVAGIDVDRTYSISENWLFILMESIYTNTTASDIINIYASHNVDPDNDKSLWSSYKTNNKILSQYTGTGTYALVIATQNPGQAGPAETDGSAVSLYSADPRAKVTQGWFANHDAANIYNAVSPLVATVWSETLDQDTAISIAFDIGTLPAGESTKIIYAYNLSGDTTDLETFAALMAEEDEDDDGLVASQEAELGTDPLNPDTDGDGVNDGVEVAVGTNPLTTDSDWDGYSDGEELTGVDDIATAFIPSGISDPADACSPNLSFSWCDQDNDDLTNDEEVLIGTDPTDSDSDNDGIDDGDEIYGPDATSGTWDESDPLDACDPDDTTTACDLSTIPTFSGATISSDNPDPGYATIWDMLIFELILSSPDTWSIVNSLDFTVWTWSTLSTGTFPGSSTLTSTGSATYIVTADDYGSPTLTGVAFTDGLGNTLTWATLPYIFPSLLIIDTIFPEISFVDDVVAWPVQSDTINVDVSDDYLDEEAIDYWFSSDAICDGSDTFWNTLAWSTDIIFDTEDHNWSYVCIKATDYAGNITYQISEHPLNIDITAPVSPVIESPDDGTVTSDTTPTIEGTGEIDAIITLTIGEETYTWGVDSSGNWSIDPIAPLPEGSYSVSVIQTDEAGNTSPEVSIDITIDTTAPTLTEITTISTPGNDSTPDYTFSTDEDGSVTYGGSCSSITDAWTIWDITVTFDILSDTTYTDCTIIITDAAGNTSNPLSVTEFIVDTTPPVITIVGDNPITVELWSLYSDLWATALDSVDGDITSNIVTVNPVDTWVLGSYIITYNVVDTAGNPATEVTKVVNVIDTTAPLFIIWDDVLSWPTQTDTLNVIVTDLDELESTFEYWFSSDASCDGSDTFWNSFTSWEDIVFSTEAYTGMYVCFKWEDVTGNITYQISSYPLNIDTTAPAKPTTIPDMTDETDSGVDNIDDTTNDMTPDFIGVCREWEIVTLYIDAVADSSIECLDSIYSLTPSSPLSEWVNDISVTFTDVAENESEKSAVLKIVVDSESPAPIEVPSLSDDTDSGLDSGDEITFDTTPTITGTWEIDAIVTILIEDVAYTWAVNASGSWIIDIPGSLIDGTYTSTITQTDASGNTSESVEFNFTIDTENLIPSILGPIEGDEIVNSIESTDVIVSWTAEAWSIVTVSFDDGGDLPVEVEVLTDTAGNWTLKDIEADISTLNPGDISVSVISVDPAGNTSTETSLLIQYNPILPTIVLPVEEVATSTWVMITWVTDVATSSEIIYGLTSTMNETTGKFDVDPRVTSHSFEIKDLLACTTYFYNTVSQDASGNILEDGIHTFKTPGCAWEAEIIEDNTTNVIPNLVWGTVTLTWSTSWASLVDLTIPTAYNSSHDSCSDGAYFQLKKLEEDPVEKVFWKPTNVQRTIYAYELSAYCNPDERVTSFDAPITVSMSYQDADTKWVSPDTIKVYRYNTLDNAWESLDNCIIDTDSKMVTCETDNFSTFALFGSIKLWRSSGWGWWSSTTYCRDKEAINYRSSGRVDNRKCIYEEQEGINIYPDEGIDFNSAPEQLAIEDSTQQEWAEDELSTHKKIYVSSAGLEYDYTLSDDYDSCPIIRDINDEQYEYITSGIFWDEDDSIYKDEILKFKEIGIVDWYEDGTFAPLRNISRTEFLKVVLMSHCYDYREEDTSTLLYWDVDKASWQARVIKKAETLGIVNGDSDEAGNPIFRPNDVISKAEAVKVLMRMSMIQAWEPVSLWYSDITTSWHIPYIRTGQTLGLFNPSEDSFKFSPDDGVMRQDMVHLITELVHLYR